MTFNNSIIQNIPFGVSLPPYQSKSTGAGFEDILQHLKQDLKAAELRRATSILSPGLLHDRTFAADNDMDFLLVSQLFRMDTGAISPLGDLLLMALQESRLASIQAAREAETGEKSIESQIDERYKFNLSKIGGLLKTLV